MKRLIPAVLLVMLAVGPAWAKVDLVTLPTRDTVQLTIYNSADMTLVRDNRTLTLKEGANKLQFSWAETLIDPTSLELQVKNHADKIHIMDLIYPPRVRNLGLWNIESEVSGKVPAEISYLTSGLSWRAFYMGTLTPDESRMRLQGFVRVTNNSGEDYENAQTRLIVGKVNILDQIAALARREYPYGRPGPVLRSEIMEKGEERGVRRKAKAMLAMEAAPPPPPPKPKAIAKEGLSEYFLYTIEGTETIPDGWSKRLPSFDAADVTVVNLYKYEEERYGRRVVRFLSFKNDKEHSLGETPIPGGSISVMRTADKEGRLSYEGQSRFKYIPVDEDVELNLGAVTTVVVEPKLMDFRTSNYLFDRKGNISGWDEIREFKVEVKNTRDVAVKVEAKRNFSTGDWELKHSGSGYQYEKVDLDTVKFTLNLPARSKTEFGYVLTTHHGRRAE